MLRTMMVSVALTVVVLLPGPEVVRAQGTPETLDLPGSDPMWSGTYVEQLPNCVGEPLCPAHLNQDVDQGNYFHGIIQNNTNDVLRVNRIAITQRDDTRKVSASGDSVNISPADILPGAHALIGTALDGEYIPSVDSEVTFDFETEPSSEVFGTPIQVNYANVRGAAIVGEMTNTSDLRFEYLYATAICFNEDGNIIFSGNDQAGNGPYGSGDISPFAIPFHGKNCDRFVVFATGNLY